MLNLAIFGKNLAKLDKIKLNKNIEVKFSKTQKNMAI
jgi:hypothetical protein